MDSLRTPYGLLIDDTRPLSVEDYHRALDEVIEISRKIGAVSVYTYGEISNPGISDLDVVIVIPRRDIQFPFDILSPDTRWILSHTPVLLTVDDFQHAGEFMDTSRFRHVWGRNLGVPGVPADAKKKLVVNYGVKRIAGIYRTFYMGTLRARGLLLHIHSIRYSFDMLGMKRPEYFHEVSLLRRKWFEKDTGRLRELLRLSLMSFEIMGSIFNTFRRKRANSVRFHNWIWKEGDFYIPPLKKHSLHLPSRVREIEYYLRVFEASMPGEALELVDPVELHGWRALLNRIASKIK